MIVIFLFIGLLLGQCQCQEDKKVATIVTTEDLNNTEIIDNLHKFLERHPTIDVWLHPSKGRAELEVPADVLPPLRKHLKIENIEFNETQHLLTNPGYNGHRSLSRDYTDDNDERSCARKLKSVWVLRCIHEFYSNYHPFAEVKRVKNGQETRKTVYTFRSLKRLRRSKKVLR